MAAPVRRPRRKGADTPCPICGNDRCGAVWAWGVPCRPKRCEVCFKLMYGRDCPECGAPRGKHVCRWPDSCNCEAVFAARKETP